MLFHKSAKLLVARVSIELLCFCSLIIWNLSSSGSDELRYYFLLHKKAPLELAAGELINDSDPAKVILITNSAYYATLSSDTKSNFYRIITVDNYNTKNLQPIINNARKELQIEQFDILTAEENLMRTMAALRDHYRTKLFGSDELDRFLNKLTMKQLLAGVVALPRYITFNPRIYDKNKHNYLQTIASQLGGFPLFAKPVNAGGAYDAHKLVNYSDLVIWASKHATAENYEIDEFIDGNLYHVDSLVQHNKIIFAAAAQYLSSSQGNAIGDNVGGITLPSDSMISRKLLEVNRLVLEKLSPLPDGAFHLELFERKDGEILFLEIAARPGGGSVPLIYRKSQGVNLILAHLRLQMGVFDISTLPAAPITKEYAAYIWFPVKNGIVTKCLPLPNLKSSHHFTFLVKEGTEITDFPQHNASSAHLLLWNTDYKTLAREWRWVDSNYNPVVILSK